MGAAPVWRVRGRATSSGGGIGVRRPGYGLTMAKENPTPQAGSPAPTTGATDGRTPQATPASEAPTGGRRRGTANDPLRGSRTSRAWVALVGLVVLLILLVVFIAQNTGHVPVRFLGWTWHPPLAVALLATLVGGMVLAVVAGSLRIWQLHRRVRRSSGS